MMVEMALSVQCAMISAQWLAYHVGCQTRLKQLCPRMQITVIYVEEQTISDWQWHPSRQSTVFLLFVTGNGKWQD